MALITIEEELFNELLDRISQLTEEVYYHFGEDRNNIILDNQDVCLLLHITPQTLRTYRQSGLLPYTQIGRKFCYKRSDLNNLLQASTIHNNTRNGN